MSHTLFPSREGKLSVTLSLNSSSLMKTEGGDPRVSAFTQTKLPLAFLQVIQKGETRDQCKEKPGSDQEGRKEGSQGRKAAQRASYRESVHCREQSRASCC